VLAAATVCVAVVLAIAAARSTTRFVAQGAEPDDPEPTGATPYMVPVKEISPKCDPDFTFSDQEPAQVEPYYTADVVAQVAGPIKFIRKDVNSRVVKGEVLAEIDVPDVVAELATKEALIEQRKRELELAQRMETTAQAAADVAAGDIRVKQAEIDEATSMRDYRHDELVRLKGLAQDQTATQQVVAEHEQLYLSTVASVRRAEEGVSKARLALKEAQAKADAAHADVRLKEALVAVAKKERDKAQALLDFAKVRAPFDGVITRRKVDPGSFVQNATTANTQPLLRVERTDIVTVVAKVPDTFANYVTDGETEVILEMSDLPGVLIHGKVTRHSPSLENANRDHTMPVEVDLYTGSAEEYRKMLEKEKVVKYVNLRDGPLPLPPTYTGAGAGASSHRLLPGMYGEMRLIFSKLPNVYLLPSDAILHEGGNAYVYLEHDGKAHKFEVEVQTDDGKLAKVVTVGKDGVRRNLTGDEQVIYSNLNDLSEGQAVSATRGNWNPGD
jgi:multidrug resistance efflux pump